MTHHLYPTEITKGEKRLGFELIQIYRPEGLSFELPSWVDVVAKILSDSDIIIKRVSETDGSVYFKHLRYGRFVNLPEMPADWKPVGTEGEVFSEPEPAIFEANIDADDIYDEIRVIGERFPRTEADLEP